MSDFNTQSSKQRIIKIKSLKQAMEEIEQENEEDALDEATESAQQKVERLTQEVKKLYSKKETLIEETKTEIRQLKHNWVDEKKTLTKQAEENGYTSGYDNGKQESLKKYEELLNKANSIILATKNDYTKKIENAEKVILKLSIHMAKKVLGKELKEHPDTFISLVHGAIQEVKDQKVIFLYLHPDKYEVVLQRKTELTQAAGIDVELTILVDYGLQLNSCIIEYSSGQIDASIDTQLDIIKKHLIELGKDSR